MRESQGVERGYKPANAMMVRINCIHLIAVSVLNEVKVISDSVSDHEINNGVCLVGPPYAGGLE